MSQKREKKRREILKAEYERRISQWVMSEPPRLMFISHWKWERNKPQYNPKSNK